MTETGRRSLLGALTDRAPRQEIDPALIERTAATHGFDDGAEKRAEPRTEEPAAKPETAPARPSPAPDVGEPPKDGTSTGLVLRRERKLKNRSIQFNVRLKPETVDFIYRRANERSVDLADVIEELVDLASR